MKLEHSIYDWNCQVLSNDAGKAIIQIKGDGYSDYKPEDFNVHFAIETLITCKLLEKLSIGHYSFYKSQYLYDKAISQPSIAITGENVNTYTHLYMLDKKLKLYDRTPATPDEIVWVMKELEKYYPAEKIAETKADTQEIHTLIYHKQTPIWKSFQEKVAPNLIRTYEWKRLQDGSFDYSLPATLFLNTVTFDEKEYKKLMTVVEQIAKKFTISHKTDTENKPIILLEIEYENVQPKPKKTKVPPIDFASLEGKEVTTSNYFYTLTERGWKYDREESDLFYMLSKTFWEKGIKVSLIFQEHGCIPPDGEENVIECVDFFKFDKNKYKEKTIYTQFIVDNYDFETIDEYIAYFSEQYPSYIPYSDFNTKDFDLLERIELADVPTAIQKEVWTDLCNCKA